MTMNKQDMSMKWHNFLCYFLLWLRALIAICVAVATDYDEIFVIICILIAIYDCIIAIKLIQRKANAPQMLMWLLGVEAGLSFVFPLMMDDFTDYDFRNVLIQVCFFLINKTYYKKRKHLFTKNTKDKIDSNFKQDTKRDITTYVEDKKYDFRNTTDAHIETYNNIARQHHTVVKQKPATHTVVLSSEQQEASQILKLLKNTGIEYFYHFTSKRNLESIKKHGGLYSWKELEKRGINAPFIGGSGDNGLSHKLDLKTGLADYVRLSFCKDHPMSFRHKQSGEPIVLLAIDITVATLPNTKFSNINATDNMCTVAEGLKGLKLVDFNAVKRTHVSRDDSDFKPHQAEILVKNHIPIKYIKGIYKTHIN